MTNDAKNPSRDDLSEMLDGLRRSCEDGMRSQVDLLSEPRMPPPRDMVLLVMDGIQWMKGLL